MKKLVKETAFALLGVGIVLTPAFVAAEESQQAGSVRTEIAKAMLYGTHSKGVSGYKWNAQRNVQTHSDRVVTTQSEVMSNVAGYKWGRIEGQGDSASADNTGSVAAAEAGYKWGIRSDADQAGYKWGIRSDVDQAGYKWGIRSDADQAGYKWGIRSDVDQAGYKWGIRSDADQAGYKWGIR
ncbi:hypothetical protein [Pseudohaliea sp.]|uniref:hypothetical protein n=1 Tax=Pseudohaliea sp. TaxID=2740289 RepID=UPI0032EC129E